MQDNELAGDNDSQDWCECDGCGARIAEPGHPDLIVIDDQRLCPACAVGPSCIVCRRRMTAAEFEAERVALGLPLGCPPVCQLDCLYAAERMADDHPDLAAARAALLAHGVDLAALTTRPMVAW
jgi:hypothetical protein